MLCRVRVVSAIHRFTSATYAQRCQTPAVLDIFFLTGGCHMSCACFPYLFRLLSYKMLSVGADSELVQKGIRPPRHSYIHKWDLLCHDLATSARQREYIGLDFRYSRYMLGQMMTWA